MEINDIIRLMEAVSENGLTSFKIEEGNLKLSIKKEVQKETVMVSVPGAAGIPAVPVSTVTGVNGMAADGSVIGSGMASVTGNTGAGMAGTAADQAASQNAASLGITADTGLDTDRVIASPLVGTFYNSSSPDADPFVKVGDTVKKGQVLGIIEAMKLMNEIESEFDGVVEAILVGNEDVVEYGQPLFRIR